MTSKTNTRPPATAGEFTAPACPTVRIPVPGSSPWRTARRWLSKTTPTTPPSHDIRRLGTKCYNPPIKVVTGTVVNGRVEVPPDIAEGSQVAILAPGTDE